MYSNDGSAAQFRICEKYYETIMDDSRREDNNKKYKKEIEEEGKRKLKVKEPFRIQVNTDSVWYSKGVSTYSFDKKFTKCISDHEHLRNRILELEEVLSKKGKVAKIVFIYLY